MKYNTAVSSKPGKNRKAHFNACTLKRRIIMSAPLSKELKEKYNVRCVPIRKGDEVLVVTGKNQNAEGKVVTVYRKKWCIHIDRLNRETKRGMAKPIGIKPSNCVVTKLHLDKDREALLARRRRDNIQKVTSCYPETLPARH